MDITSLLHNSSANSLYSLLVNKINIPVENKGVKSFFVDIIPYKLPGNVVVLDDFTPGVVSSAIISCDYLESFEDGKIVATFNESIYNGKKAYFMYKYGNLYNGVDEIEVLVIPEGFVNIGMVTINNGHAEIYSDIGAIGYCACVAIRQ